MTSLFGAGEAYGLRFAEPGETLVVGLGNPILGDDGVGWRVIDELDGMEHAEASLQQACVGGVSLMEIMVGYRARHHRGRGHRPRVSARQRLVPAARRGGDEPGKPSRFDA